MRKICITKIIQLLTVMILISFFSFAVIYIAPGDISSMYISMEMTEEQQAAVKEDLGLDKSLAEQYFNWAKLAIKGDFGVSLSNRSAVVPQINASFDGNSAGNVGYTCNSVRVVGRL